MLDRTTRHHGLIAHWLILAALYLGLQGLETFESRHPKWSWKWSWVLLVVTSGLVHLYICFMVVVIYLSTMFVFINRERWRRLSTYRSASLPFLFLLAALYLEGAFVVGPRGWGFASWQFSLFSMNLLAPLVPIHHDKPEDAAYVSYFLDSQQVPNAGYHEGFNYLGLGVLSLVLIALIVVSYRAIRRCLKAPTLQSQPTVSLGPLLATFLSCCFLAGLSLSNEIRLGLDTVATYRFFGAADQFAAIFRSAGRFFWPMGYLLLWLALRPVGLIARSRLIVGVALLQAALMLQLVDLSQLIKHVATPYKTVVRFDTPFRSKFWSSTLPRYHDIFYHPPGDETFYVQLGVLAAPHRVGINVVFKPRSNPDGDHGESRRLESELQTGQLRAGTLFIFKDQSLLEKLKRKLPSDRYILSVVDDFCVAAQSAVRL